ncbi:uncharacterized protein MONOS_9098 [Monocercomonoides exilis]|uniref:uncharacterized protein n=1 Tax=Monocercomonoides exilis TaxID=2049356 RepID=UPI00355A27D0|nr:hypothetical protein MONOS_9098 [Monocercomonoides exilis]|eukprot:MONOS_9098.1-p1 / transcript=MONOS_9098.1 / gene=MONOS_9098 / organism=Monocercomonoides_exilis_PA203 / gene_product=unspecified product / transcript_product=unspecified product / location=Mono_scaffold00364:45073-45359(+) / protein_length=79 / sequence_SO=supercontig / SO=protein_coding / is_pseudo=false
MKADFTASPTETSKKLEEHFVQSSKKWIILIVDYRKILNSSQIAQRHNLHSNASGEMEYGKYFSDKTVPLIKQSPNLN